MDGAIAECAALLIDGLLQLVSTKGILHTFGRIWMWKKFIPFAHIPQAIVKNARRGKSRKNKY